MEGKFPSIEVSQLINVEGKSRSNHFATTNVIIDRAKDHR